MVYYITRGMLETVVSWITEIDIEIQYNILEAYESNFSKYTNNIEANKIFIIWKSK